jgi:hypothetical protein
MLRKRGYLISAPTDGVALTNLKRAPGLAPRIAAQGPQLAGGLAPVTLARD